MKTKLLISFCVITLALFTFGVSESPAPYLICGDGEINQEWEECEVGVPCANPDDVCNESECLCESTPPECGDGVINQEWEQCEVGIPCANVEETCDEINCVCEPPTGGEGCTPGYWKNHVENWGPSGLNPGDDFDTTFGVDYFDPDITLEEAVHARGGGLKKVARHGTAALINALHPAVGYPATAAQVIAAVQSGDVNALVDYNELSDTCPED